MSTCLARISATFGLTAGAITAVIASTLTPHFPATVVDLVARAVLLLGVVFAVAFVTTYAGFRIGAEARTPQARRISLDVAITSLWLPPLMMFAVQQSWLVGIIWAVLLFHMARFFASVKSQTEEARPGSGKPNEEPAFSVLPRDFPFGNSVFGALLLQSALFAIISGHEVLAGLFYFSGAAAMAHRTFQMFRDASNLHAWNREKIMPVLGTVTLLTVFAWLPSMSMAGGVGGSAMNGGSGGPLTSGSQTNAQSAGKRHGARPGNATALDWLRSLLSAPKVTLHGDSFASAKQIFAAKFPATDRGEAGSDSQKETGIPSREPVVGPVFPGVELYPEAAHRIKLIAPPPVRRSGFGASRSDPLSIPFDGVYWFWKGPSEGPPPNVEVIHGSPSARFFRSTDHEIMSMEARESLGFMVDPKSYGAIEIVLENVDPFPNTVSIALRIRDSANPGKRFQSLGLLRVTSTSLPDEGRPKVQTLRFAVPPSIPKFDELVVTYYLRGERSDRSARIAIQGFRLVPRAG